MAPAGKAGDGRPGAAPGYREVASIHPRIVRQLMALAAEKATHRLEEWAREVAREARAAVAAAAPPEGWTPGERMWAIRRAVFGPEDEVPVPVRRGKTYLIPCAYRETLEALNRVEPTGFDAEDVCEWCFTFWSEVDPATRRVLSVQPGNVCYFELLERAV